MKLKHTVIHEGGKRKKRHEQYSSPANRPFSITTTLGTNILPPNAMVYVSLGGGTFIRKAVSDLSEGDAVLFSKEVLRGGGTTITLEDVDAVLRESRRYTQAAAELYVKCEDGSHTTRLRAELLDGATNEDSRSFWPKELTSDVQLRVRVRGGREHELTDVQAEAAAVFIRETLQAREAEIGNPVVSVGQIKNGWLAGITIAPHQSEKVFEALEGIAHGLGELRKSEAFRTAYRTYVVIRQSVMRAINDVLGSGRSQSPSPALSEGLEESLSTRPEIQLVVNHFITDVSERYAVARIVGLKQVKEPRREEPKEESVLGRGIVTGFSDAPEITVKFLDRLDLEICVLMDLKNRVVHDYFKRHHSGGVHCTTLCAVADRRILMQLIYDSIGDRLGYSSSEHLKKSLERMRENGIDTMGFCDTNPVFMDDCIRVADEFVRALEGGELDAQYGFSRGRCYAILTKFYETFNARPMIDNYYTHLLKLLMHLIRLGRTSRQAISTRDVEREIRETERILTKRYGRSKRHTTGGVLAENIAVEMRLDQRLFDQIYEDGTNPLELLRRTLGASELERMMSNYSDSGENIFVADSTAREVLTELGFADAMRLFPFSSR